MPEELLTRLLAFPGLPALSQNPPPGETRAPVLIIHFKSKELCGAYGASNSDAEEPDRAAPHHRDGARSNLSRQSGMNSVAQRIKDRGVVGGNGRIEFPDI